jgi:hypothetical protein
LTNMVRFGYKAIMETMNISNLKAQLSAIPSSCVRAERCLFATATSPDATLQGIAIRLEGAR